MQYLSPVLDRETNTERTKYHRDSWTLVRCQETGIVFLPNPPEYSELEEDIAWEKTTKIERERRKNDEPILSNVSLFSKYAKRKLFPKRNKMVSLALAEATKFPRSGVLRVLDIGCGTGGHLVDIYRGLSANGYSIEPLGIEVSKAIAARAQEKLNDIGGKVFQTNAFDAAAELDQCLVQIIIMRSFLEHERHPLRLLKSLAKNLAPNGAIIIKVPNYASLNRVVRGNRWCGFRYPDHVNYFSPETLRILAAEAGFVVSRQTILDRFPMSDSMYAVLHKKTLR
ncbi:MAG: class I SAM-dependent methyltransferase [Thioalkalivibrio sp.]